MLISSGIDTLSQRFKLNAQRFVSKLTDSLGEEFETENWLDYSKDCKYLQEETHERILSEYDEVRKMLISMINNSDKWCL